MNIDFKTLILSVVKIIVNTLPLAISLSIIMNIGAISQRMLTQFLASEEANLYDTMYNGLICNKNANFITWFTEYISFWYLVPSVLIVYVAMKGKTAKKILGYMSILIFFTLTGIDIFFDDFNNLLVNIVSNFFGSFIIVGILILFLDTGRIINEFFDINNTLYRKLVNGLISISAGFFIAFIVYTVDKNIYFVTTSKIDLTMKLPIYGNYKVDKKSNDNYGLFASTDLNLQKKIGDFSWTGFSENFLLDWKKNLNHKTYKVEIRVLDECYEDDKKAIQKVLSNPPTFILENINKISLAVNNGAYGMFLSPTSWNNGVISIVDEKKVKFNIEKSKKKGYILTRMISPSAELNHFSWVNKASYVLFLPNLGVTDSKVELINRNVRLNTGNQDINITLRAKTVDSNKKMQCHTLQESKNGIYHLNSIYGGIILTIQELSNPQTSILFSKTDEEKTQIKGIRGWIIADEVSHNDLSEYIKDGNLQSLNLIAPIKELYIDEQEKKVVKSSNHAYIDEANLTGEITEDDLIRFTGTSNTIYINQKRANLSRWEKIDVAFKLALIPIFGVILAFLTNRIRVIMTENRQY